MLTVRLAVGFWDVLGPFDLEKAFDRAAVEVSSGAVWVPLPRLEILVCFFPFTCGCPDEYPVGLWLSDAW